MSMNIKNPETHRLARELARRNGETVTLAVTPLIPPAKRGGGKRRRNMREVVNGVMYVLSTGCQWRYIRKYLPPRSTVNDYFCL